MKGIYENIFIIFYTQIYLLVPLISYLKQEFMKKMKKK